MASKVMTNNAVASNVMAEAVSDAEIVAQFRQRDCWGLYTSVDLKGCDPVSIRDAEKIHRFIIELCDLIDMKRFGEPQIIHFGPNERVAGFSMTQLIETSLISGHFANETNAAYLDIFSCKEYEPSKAAEFCKNFFGAESATYQVLFRD
ncbi:MULTISPECIES: S-adenosylmethionine decarboxylase [unclassified Methanoculleus]|jgi:S-adenosylmethionine/arginine decarboxylase-like enzyme|uniref:S-adenosylmethionine decarboxylase n=1 Tax=Methanoculleus palmolei TaxID=72612 RepID=A0ABD8A9Q0_9EURY|nr:MULTISPECIES: S-adenosylmethionine decarboxylase [unclassified Methanoculleus]MDD2473559.1 S-adenosylmethionine decarboxylase [Methanoculleus sp.]WOX56234.1 S-adenosylmethionine decarboxylase [Methanoculleus palmolei]